jgi:AmmeMemoRadiSam system protein A
MLQPSQHALPTQVQFTERQRFALLAVAKRSLVNSLIGHQPPQPAVADAVRKGLAQGATDLGTEDHDQLLAQGACFVTLWRRDTGELRGCRGECSAHQPLASAVGFMALASALDDPRFAAVTAGELADLRIEISVLTPLHPIVPEQVEIGKHGLMIVEGRRRGLLLPQVAVEHQMNREQYLEAVCWKAGLPADAWRSASPGLWAFETASWTEE